MGPGQEGSYGAGNLFDHRREAHNIAAAGARGRAASRPPDLVEVSVEIDVELELLDLFGPETRTVSGSGLARVEGTRRD